MNFERSISFFIMHSTRKYPYLPQKELEMSGGGEGGFKDQKRKEIYEATCKLEFLGRYGVSCLIKKSFLEKGGGGYGYALELYNVKCFYS